MVYTANQIILLRCNLGISQEDFAKSIEYSRSYVKDIESGRVKPSRSFLEAVKSKYGISVDALLGNLGTQISAGLNASFLTSDKGFIYLYDFTDSGLDAAEKGVSEFLSEKISKTIDGRKITGRRALFLELLEDYTQNISTQMIKEINYEYVVLIRFSESPLKKDLWGIYKDLARYMPGNLIVIDKPSYLEKNIKHLYHTAYPIHFKDSFGFAHRPSE